MKINSISPDKHNFTQITASIVEPPKRLYFIGKLPEKPAPAVAIVGTRKPTAYGKEVAHQLAFELAQQGVLIISGLALGIDSIAHKGALEAGKPTIAVLANGVDKPYPASHTQLAKQIIDSGGALISEYKPGTPPLPHQFLARNRIVSGLAQAVVVVEAAKRSGTLSTVSHALDQGKEVFAVPGNITSPLSVGCNTLIKQGAAPVNSSQDILDIVAPNISQPAQAQMPLGDTPAEQNILELMQSGLRDGEILLVKSQLTAQDFNQTLSMLEIKGQVRPLGGNQWSLR